MKTTLQYMALLMLCASSLFAQERYSKIGVTISGREDLVQLARLGIDLEGATRKPGPGIEIFVSDQEVRLLEENGIAFTTLIPDWAKYYAERQQLEQESMPKVLVSSKVKNFRLGSMGGALTMAELGAELDSMRAKYPDLISAKDSIGRTYENRPLWAVNITDHFGRPKRPQALYMAVHHAREPFGMMSLVYFMWYVLENYGTDPEVSMLLRDRELWFIPLVNPDGYCYNQSTNPAGGGMWSKNRTPFPPNSGADLNRNYGFKWGYNDVGSSPFPSARHYRGPAPFSELENQAIRDFVVARHFKTANTFHMFGDALLSGLSYLDAETPDSVFFRKLAADMTLFNRYSYMGQGTGNPANGEACDWLYGDTLAKGRVYPLTVEVGADYDGFWPMNSRILPLVEENLRTNLVIAHAAGQFIRVNRHAVTCQFSADSARILVEFTNLGVEAPPLAIDITVSSPDLAMATTHFAAFPWKGGVPLEILTSKKVPVGTNVPMYFQVSYPGGMTQDTVTFRLGPAEVIYADDAEGTRSRWRAESNQTVQWDTTDEMAHSGRLSFSESPQGNYPHNLNSTFLLDSALVLNGTAAELRFWMRGWSEDDFDCLRVEVSTDRGGTWGPLTGKYTAPASGGGTELPFGSPVIDGYKYEWIEEVMDLGDFIGKTIHIRFRFSSDNGTLFTGLQLYGFYLDDIKVLSYGHPLVGVETTKELLPKSYSLDQNFPNPFNPSTTIRYGLPHKTTVQLSVFNTLGQEVARIVQGEQEVGYHEVMFDGNGLSSGVYFYQLKAGDFVETRRLLLLR